MSDALLEARDLRLVRRVDHRAVTVLDGVDLTLERGEVLDVSGPSGCGKTTLLRALALMLPGATGELALAGESAAVLGPREWRSRVALLSQQAVIFPGRVRENLLAPWSLKVRERACAPSEDDLRAALDAVGLADVALDRDAARLSVGQSARVALVRARLTRPLVLLLDEPDANLDEESAAQVATLTARFAEDGGGVVRVRHHRPDTIASRAMRLESGCLTEVSHGC